MGKFAKKEMQLPGQLTSSIGQFKSSIGQFKSSTKTTPRIPSNLSKQFRLSTKPESQSSSSDRLELSTKIESRARRSLSNRLMSSTKTGPRSSLWQQLMKISVYEKVIDFEENINTDISKLVDFNKERLFDGVRLIYNFNGEKPKKHRVKKHVDDIKDKINAYIESTF